MSEKPAIRIVHHMARTGGTVLSKCLASMQQVVLLSELHPLGREWFDPLEQAQQWFGLLSAAERRGYRDLAFADAVQLVWTRYPARGRPLVIRD